MKANLLLPVIAVIIGMTGSLHAKNPDLAAATKKVDELLAVGWAKHKITPNPLVGDEVFLRRAYLTVVGRIPTLEETQAFLTWQAPDKRSKLVDKLLSSDGYVHHFVNYWADVLRAQSQGVGGSTTAQSYMNYLRQALRENKHFDQLTRELISAEGSCFDTGAIGYYMRDRGMPLDNLSNTTRIFLGTRMECAQCHDHPFDKWRQKDFYQMAAFTHNMSGGSFQSDSITEAQKMMTRDKSLDADTRDLMRRAITEATRSLRDTIVTQNKASLRLPHDYKYSDAKPKDVAQAAVMFGKPVALQKEANPIQEFAKWLTSPENPRFTNVIANRLWKKVFGLGLIEPVDELMDSSVASNPELMKFLEQTMRSVNYDMKAYLKVLLNTQAFSRTATREEVNAAEPYYFQGPVFRRMSSEQIWDSLVTLVSPDPDQPNWSSREREIRDLEKRNQLAELLKKTEAPLILEAAKQVAVLMREQNKEFDKLRVELEEARAKDDKERVKDIQRRLNQSQTVLRQTVSKCFYEAAKKSGNQEVQKALAEAADGGDMEMAMMNMMDDSRVDARDMPLSDADMKQIQADAVLVGIKPKDDKSLKSYTNYRKTLHQTWCRAAELPSPAPRGHFLREFGQSDRDIIENANDEASVPQALAMMNSSLVAQLSGGWSELAMNLRKCQSPEDKINTLYLSLFSAKPTAKEQAALFELMETAGTGNTTFEDMILGAISTQRFLFIE